MSSVPGPTVAWLGRGQTSIQHTTSGIRPGYLQSVAPTGNENPPSHTNLYNSLTTNRYAFNSPTLFKMAQRTGAFGALGMQKNRRPISTSTLTRSSPTFLRRQSPMMATGRIGSQEFRAVEDWQNRAEAKAAIPSSSVGLTRFNAQPQDNQARHVPLLQQQQYAPNADV